MRIRTLLVVIALLLVAAFMALNWGAFATPASLNLLATTIEAPPALIMAAMLALVVLAGAVYMALWQSRILLESRRHAKELQAQRELADQAEASRFTALQNFIEERLQRQEAQAVAQHGEILARMDASDGMSVTVRRA